MHHKSHGAPQVASLATTLILRLNYTCCAEHGQFIPHWEHDLLWYRSQFSLCTAWQKNERWASSAWGPNPPLKAAVYYQTQRFSSRCVLIPVRSDRLTHLVPGFRRAQAMSPTTGLNLCFVFVCAIVDYAGEISVADNWSSSFHCSLRYHSNA